MESPDISAIAEDSEALSTVPYSETTASEKSQDELIGNSESLLAGLSPLADQTTSQDAETEESQSLLVGIGSNNRNVGDVVDELEMVVDKSDENISGERNNEVGMDEENSEDIGGGGSEAILETEMEDNTEDNQQEEMETGDFEDDENDDTENTSASINLPFGRVKKIMKICVNTNPDEEEPREETTKLKRKSGKGSKKSTGGSSGSTANFIIAKEAIYLTAAATELFVSAVAQQSARLAVSSKKKNVTLEHLKRSLSSVESYEFLQGCFNPSILIGD